MFQQRRRASHVTRVATEDREHRRERISLECARGGDHDTHCVAQRTMLCAQQRGGWHAQHIVVLVSPPCVSS
jgi:hypothetical protein